MSEFQKIAVMIHYIPEERLTFLFIEGLMKSLQIVVPTQHPPKFSHIEDPLNELIMHGTKHLSRGMYAFLSSFGKHVKPTLSWSHQVRNTLSECFYTPLKRCDQPHVAFSCLSFAFSVLKLHFQGPSCCRSSSLPHYISFSRPFWSEFKKKHVFSLSHASK